MATRAGERPGLGGAAKLVADKASTIVRLELALAAAEIKKKVSAIGTGLGLVIGAAILALFALGFFFATAAEGLSHAVPMWLALLIVAVVLALVAAVLGKLGANSIQKGTPPMPEQAIEEASLTTEALKNGRH
jgi:tetrahydromethanopterin S-methyltransferase subunit C